MVDKFTPASEGRIIATHGGKEVSGPFGPKLKQTPLGKQKDGDFIATLYSQASIA